MKLKFRKKDIIFIILVLIILLIAFIFISFRSEGKFVRISRDNQVIQTVSLETDGEYVFNEEDETNTLVIKDGKADVISANCYNQICVNTKSISEVGEVISCLPHGLIIEIIEDEN